MLSAQQNPAGHASDQGSPQLLLGFARDLFQRTGGLRVGGCMALVLLCTLTESFGLLALVPLLQTLGGAPGGPVLAWLAQHGLPAEPGPMLLAFLTLVLLRTWLGRQRDIQLLALRLDYLDALRRDLETSLAGASWRYLVKLRHAEVMHVLYDDLSRINQGTHQGLTLLSTAGLGLASLIAAAFVAPLWSLVLLLPLVWMAWLLRSRMGQSGQLGARLSKGQLDQMASSRDLLGGLKMVKTHGLEAQHLTRLRTQADVLRNDLLRFARTQSSTRGWFELGGALIVAAFVYGTVTWGQRGLPELVMTVLAFSRLMPVLRDSQLLLQQLLHTLPAFYSTIAWMARNRNAAEEPRPLAVERLPLRQSLAVESVTFRYRDEDPATLHDMDLLLQAGTCTAITGPSGSGKTTLADLVLGLLTPSQGHVRVDGTPLDATQTLQAWRQSVAYVSQDTYLFASSVRDNLCWLAGKRPDDELWHALEQADAASFVAASPGGLDHHLGERGEGFSGGQRQRLALARALLCKPALLVLDEVTSHLDTESEERVNAAIRRLRGNTTILLIAHRPSALAPAERVLALEAGRIVSDQPN